MTHNLELNTAYQSCELLKINCIKSELEEYLKGSTLKNIKLEKGEWECSFECENRGLILLTISSDKFSIAKQDNNKQEIMTVDESLLMTQIKTKKYEKGVIYSLINKKFSPSPKFGNEFVLIDMIEERYTFTKNKLKSLVGYIDFDSNKPISISILLRLKALEKDIDLKKVADLYTEFSTHMNYCFYCKSMRKIKDNIYPTITYLNGEEVSNVFDVNDGPDKLYRVFDLYNGVINKRNEKDVNLINLGFLSPDSYDYKGLKDITSKEVSLVGSFLDIPSEEYISYLRQLFNNKFGYKGNLELSRDKMIEAITYEMSGPELAKRQIERKLGLPYEEFELLDIDEQHKLIEEKTGKKMKPDNRSYIDGIPIDEEHFISREQVDKRLDQLTESAPKRLLKRIFQPFTKR